jgi:hypothetical protein
MEGGKYGEGKEENFILYDWVWAGLQVFDSRQGQGFLSSPSHQTGF